MSNSIRRNNRYLRDQSNPDQDMSDLFPDDSFDDVSQGVDGSFGLDDRWQPPTSPRARGTLMQRVGLVFLGMLVVGSVLAAFSLPAIENALILPKGPTTAVNAGRGPQTQAPPAQTTGQPKLMQTAMPGQGQGTNPPTNVQPALAQDSFKRASRQGWGTASDGHSWGSDSANNPVFTVANGVGLITNGRGALNATLGPATTNSELFFSGSISQFKLSNLGATVRWIDTNNWYKAYIDGKQLILLKNSGGMQMRLGAVSFPAQGGTSYTLRFRVSGNTLAASVWATGTQEPAQWMITAQDSTFQNGLNGLRVFSEPGLVIKVSTFKVTQL